MAELELFSASLAYGERHLLREVSFTLTRGEIMGLYGRNGSGKSTLLHMLYGSISKGSLRMSFGGQPLKRTEVIPNRIITLVPQQPHLPGGVKVRDLIPMYYQGQQQQDAIFYDPIIAEYSGRRINELSHGERKYFEVIFAAHLPAPLLLLDEPFSMLEPFQRERLQAFLSQQAKQKGILITDHYYQDVWSIATKNRVLSDGVLHPANSEADLRQFEYLSTSDTEQGT